LRRNVIYGHKKPFWILKIHRKKAKNGKFRQDLARFGQKWPEFARNSQVLAGFGEFWQEKLKYKQFGFCRKAKDGNAVISYRLSVVESPEGDGILLFLDGITRRDARRSGQDFFIKRIISVEVGKKRSRIRRLSGSSYR
jgi:hypothetical protein